MNVRIGDSRRSHVCAGRSLFHFPVSLFLSLAFFYSTRKKIRKKQIKSTSKQKYIPTRGNFNRPRSLSFFLFCFHACLMNYVVALFFLLIFLSGCSEYVRARRKRNEKAEQTARHKEKERGEKQKNVSLLGGGGNVNTNLLGYDICYCNL